MIINITAKPGTTIKNKTGGWRTFIPSTDYNKCTSCGTCAKVCPEGCIAMENIKAHKKEKPVTDYDFCKGCAVCAVECPIKAIIMNLDEK